MVSGAALIDGPSVAGGPGSIYDAMGGFYAADQVCDEARNEGTFVGAGCAISASGTGGKLDMSIGIAFIGGADYAAAAVTAFATTITTLASALTAGQAVWVACEVDTSGALNLNAGAAALVTTSGGPLKPSATANRVTVAYLYVPVGATAVDALLTNSNGKAKIMDARRLVTSEGPNGWQCDQNQPSWSYGTATTLTVAGIDVRSYLQKGDKLSWVDSGGVKYGVVVGIVFSTNSTITLGISSAYPVANSAISRIRFSKAANPTGFPSWFDYVPGQFGWTAGPVGLYRWKADGTQITLAFEQSSGTSGNATHNFTLPITAATITGQVWLVPCVAVEGASVIKVGYLSISSAGTTISVNALLAGGNTASGTSYAYGQIVYEM